MKIALQQVDGSIPNLALMQIAKYHELKGHAVETLTLARATSYDKIYHSKIFGFSPMPELYPQSVIGGTGIDFTNRLPADIEKVREYSYTLYPDCNYHVGQTQRGCRYACDFCVVPKKEGANRPHSALSEILTNPQGGRNVMLLDNDFFGNRNWEGILNEIHDHDLLVCFAQGLNIRLITPPQIRALSRVKFRNTKFNAKYVTFAWDKYHERDKIFAGIERCKVNGIKPQHMQFFVLIGYDTTPEQDYQRVMELKNIGALPFVMPYDRKNEYQKRFARWCNNRILFKSVKWHDYKHTVVEQRGEATWTIDGGMQKK